MRFEPKLIKSTIKKRYKRFLSDIILPNGDEITAHVPNTGSMKTCWDEGWEVFISKSDNPKRKLQYTLELTHSPTGLICVNTGLTNKIVKEALENNNISEFEDYHNIKPEKKVLDSRIDFYLTHDELVDCYIEVKNVTLLGEENQALFPDSVSTRGQKHLKDLIELKKQGNRAVMLYVINRENIKSFSPAEDIDPTYASLLKEAKDSGVEVLAYATKISPEEIYLNNKVEVIL